MASPYYDFIMDTILIATIEESEKLKLKYNAYISHIHNLNRKIQLLSNYEFDNKKNRYINNIQNIYRNINIIKLQFNNIINQRKLLLRDYPLYAQYYEENNYNIINIDTIN